MNTSAKQWLAAAAVAAAGLAPLLADSPAQAEVRASERAFARAMARRDLAAFARCVSAEAVFISGGEVVRGKANVVRDWSPLFQGAKAPFSWAPDKVEVLDSGALALSTGLVRNSQGAVIARFSTIWRRESPGVWRVIFDHGGPPTEAEKRR